MNHKLLFGCACAALVGPAGVAYAGFVDLAGGWRASWDDSLDGLVEIRDDGVATVFLGSAVLAELDRDSEVLGPAAGGAGYIT